ncbi:MAG: hypothetical protein AB1454_02675 [Candidatus Auribacterota bacterium]
MPVLFITPMLVKCLDCAILTTSLTLHDDSLKEKLRGLPNNDQHHNKKKG